MGENFFDRLYTHNFNGGIQMEEDMKNNEEVKVEEETKGEENEN